MVLRSTREMGEIDMRLFRTILGMLLLTAGLPALLAGAAFWAAMQHRDAGGAFTGTMQRVATSGYAVVVDDVDALLDADAPFVRAGDTRLRITADTSQGPAFVGIAPRDKAAAYLADLPRIAVSSIDLGTGALPMTSKLVPGTRAPEQLPGKAGIWLEAGRGSIAWNPAELRGTAYSLVIMNPAAQPGVRLESSAAVSPGWLNQATWGLLTAGTLLVMIGMIVLGWPSRRREVVYVGLPPPPHPRRHPVPHQAAVADLAAAHRGPLGARPGCHCHFFFRYGGRGRSGAGGRARLSRRRLVSPRFRRSCLAGARFPGSGLGCSRLAGSCFLGSGLECSRLDGSGFRSFCLYCRRFCF